MSCQQRRTLFALPSNPTAFIVEPIQSEAGVRVPDADYLRNAESLCRRY